MRRTALIVFISGILVLLLLMMRGPVEVNSMEELGKLEVNQKVSLIGKVESERFLSGSKKMFAMDSGIELVCDCSESFVEKEIMAEGFVSEFNGKRQVEVFSIKS